MSIGFSFDYHLDGPHQASRRVRLHHGRRSYFGEALDRIAVLIWTLSQKVDASTEEISADQKAVHVSSVHEVDPDALPPDIDSIVVCVAAGRARLLTLADTVDNELLCLWLRQEADLIEKRA